MLGVLFSIAIGVYQKKDRKPYCAVRNFVIIGNAKITVEGLKIHFAGYGSDIDNLSIARLAFWNAGKEPIRNTDITTSDPLTIAPLGNAKMLGVSVLQCNNVASKVAVAVRREKGKSHIANALLTFEYLGRDNGTVIEIIHTGLKSSDIVFTGTIIGADKIG